MVTQGTSLIRAGGTALRILTAPGINVDRGRKPLTPNSGLCHVPPIAETMSHETSSGRPGSDRPQGPAQQARLAPLGTLVATVAHEINNPVAYLLGNLAELRNLSDAMREAILHYRALVVQLAGAEAAAQSLDIESKLEHTAGMDALEELLGDAEAGAARIRDVVRDLLVLAREPQACDSRIDVNAALESVIRLVHRELGSRATLVREFDATRPIDADPTKLDRLLLNLMLNAVAACDPADSSQHRITVRSFDGPEGVQIEVEDTGRGIPDEIRDQVFVPFFTARRDKSGTGLGLFAAHQIVEAHGGEMGFRTRTGGGTVFWVVLPWEGPGTRGTDPDSR